MRFAVVAVNTPDMTDMACFLTVGVDVSGIGFFAAGVAYVLQSTEFGKRSSTKTISFKCILVFVSADFHTFSDSSEKNLLERRQIAWKNVTRLKWFLQHTLL